MTVNTNPECLLFIEPRHPAHDLVHDDVTRAFRLLWHEHHHFPDTVFWRGTHACVCGEMSDNRNHELCGFITNSLAPHYVERHRDEIPPSEVEKLSALLRMDLSDGRHLARPRHRATPKSSR